MSDSGKEKEPEEWPEPMRGVGRRLKFRRDQMDMTQTALSKLSGVALATISNVEADKRTTSVSSLIALSDALEIPYEWLFFELGPLPAPPQPKPGTGDGRRRQS